MRHRQFPVAVGRLYGLSSIALGMAWELQGGTGVESPALAERFRWCGEDVSKLRLLGQQCLTGPRLF